MTLSTLVPVTPSSGGGAGGVPAAGADGEMLAKASAADYDTEWVAPPSGGAGVPATTWNANSIVKADLDDTPVALSIPPSSFVGRPTAGVIAALTAAEAKGLLAIGPADITGLGALATKSTIVDADVAAGAAIALSKLAVNPLDRAQHTGTQTAATISDFNSAVRTNRLDQMAAPTASVAFGGQTITGLGTPANPTDAVTKGYVDGATTGGISANLYDAFTILRADVDNTPTALTINPSSLVGRGASGGIVSMVAGTAKAMLAITAGDVSDFHTAVRTNRLDQMAVPTAPVNFGGQLPTGLPSPAGATDAVNKAYADNVAAGLDFKSSVRAGATTNVNIAAPGTAIDGVTLAATNRVLLAGQTAATENGIYVWNAAGSPMTRSTDADADAEVTSGMYVFVEQGTTNGAKAFVLVTPGTITVGTTPLTFTLFSGGGTSVVGTANRITVTGAQVDVASTYAGQSSIATVGSITAGEWRVETVSGGTRLGSGAGAVMAGANSTCVGFNAGSTLTGSASTLIGSYAGGFLTTGTGNTVVGYGAAGNAGPAVGQTVVGYLANNSGATANYATALGFSTVASAAGSVALGTDSTGAGASTAVGNEIKLGTANHKVNIPGTLTIAGVTITPSAPPTGTAGRITVTGSQVDIAATYAGQASIATVGTITTGEWAVVSGSQSTRIGYQAGAGGAGQGAFLGYGAGSGTTSSFNTCVGYSAGATLGNTHNTHIGASTTGGSVGGTTCIGALSFTTNNFATALGYKASAQGTGSVAIGCDSGGAPAATTVTDEIKLGTALHKVNIPGTLTVAGVAIGGSGGITGTANRITVTAGVINIAPTYVGQASITTLGTVTTGEWAVISGTNTTKIGYGAGGAGGEGAFLGYLAGNSSTGAYNSCFGSRSGIGIGSNGHNTHVGYNTTAGDVGGSTSLGSTTYANANYATALGYRAAAQGAGSVAIGCDSGGNPAATSTANEIKLGTGSHTINIPGALIVAGTAISGGATGASCKVTIQSSPTINHDAGLTPVLITGFTGETWKDVFGMHSTSTNPGRLNLTSPGRYQVKCAVNFGSMAGGERYIYLEHVKPTTSGLAVYTKIRTAAPSRNMTLDLVVDVASVNTDEYVQLKCAQNSGSSIGLVPGGETWFEITKIA